MVQKIIQFCQGLRALFTAKETVLGKKFDILGNNGTSFFELKQLTLLPCLVNLLPCHPAVFICVDSALEVLSLIEICESH